MDKFKWTLRPYESLDNREVVQLINDAFGKSYIISKLRLFELPVLLAAVANSKVIGFCSGDLLTKSIGLLDLIVVDFKFTKQGVGTALFKKRMPYFLAQGINSFILYHWVQKELENLLLLLNMALF